MIVNDNCENHFELTMQLIIMIDKGHYWNNTYLQICK